jgi:hypothetical protein
MAMPYTMTIYPDELDRYAVPNVGDVFVVEATSETVDMHWGNCVVVRLRKQDDNNEAKRLQ